MLASLPNLLAFAPPHGRYKPIATFNDNLRGVNSLSFSKDGHYLASGGEYLTVSIRNNSSTNLGKGGTESKYGTCGPSCLFLLHRTAKIWAQSPEHYGSEVAKLFTLRFVMGLDLVTCVFGTKAQRA